METHYQPLKEVENIFDEIDVTIFKEEITETFISILKSINSENKNKSLLLVYDEKIISKLSFFINGINLQEYNIQKQSYFLSDTHPSITDQPIVVYIVEATVENTNMIMGQIEQLDKELRTVGKRYLLKDHYIIFVPKVNNLCYTIINKSPCRTFVHFKNLSIEAFPLDYDLISLENENCLREISLENNFTTLSTLARTVVKFEEVFGMLNKKNRYIKGNYSKVFNEILEKEEDSLYNEIKERPDFDPNEEIFGCICIDRTVDLISPMLTGFTFEGLINKFFGINQNHVKVPMRVFQENPKEGEEKEKEYQNINLDQTDKLYYMIKDYNFNHIRSFLPNRLKQHEVEIKALRNENAISEKLVQSLKNVQDINKERSSLLKFFSIASYISHEISHPEFKFNLSIEQRMVQSERPDTFFEHIDNMLSEKKDKFEVLRLMILNSMIFEKDKTKQYDKFKRDFLNVYGYQNVFLLNNLEKLKMLKSKKSDNNFEYIRDKLGLLFLGVNVTNPDNSAYASGGYSPITIRLIENIFTDGWNTIAPVLKKLDGVFQYPEGESDFKKPKKTKNYVLIVFIGGITYIEIAAIRYLNSIDSSIKFIIITTGIINSKSLLVSLDKTTKGLSFESFYQGIVQIGKS